MTDTNPAPGTGELIDPVTGPLREFLTEHDSAEITLDDTGALSVRVASLGHKTVTAALDIPLAIIDPTGWQPRDHRRPFGVDRGVILKASPDVDLYVHWSTGADNAAVIGTRNDLQRAGYPWPRLARAERHGTSAQPDTPGGPRWLGWDAAGLVVHNQDHAPTEGGGWLPRNKLAAFLTAKAAGDDEAAAGCLEPFDEPQPDNE